MKYAKHPKENVLPGGLGLNRCSSNQFETPSPDPGSAFRCVSRVGLGISFLWSILMQLKGKLIRCLGEAKLKTMRAAALTLFLAFSWGSSETESLENSEGGTCLYVQQALSRQQRKEHKKVVGNLRLSNSSPQSPGNEKGSELISLARCRSSNRCTCNV